MSHDATPQEPPVPLVSDRQIMDATYILSADNWLEMVQVRKEIFAIRQRYETERRYLFAEVAKQAAQLERQNAELVEAQAYCLQLEGEVTRLQQADSAAAPQPVAMPDWSNAPAWANWWAMDEDGIPYWYEDEPLTMHECWYPKGMSTVALRPCPAWLDTLQPRPAADAAS